MNHNWPGLAEETRQICESLGMNDVNLQEVKKQDIMKAVKDHDGREMVQQMERYQKLDKIKEDNPTEAKSYLETKSISDCRIIFRIRTEMVDLKDNMRGRYKGFSTNCEMCDEHVPESQSQFMVCSAYQELRAGRDLSTDKDLVYFYRDVMILRQRNQLKT